MVTVGGQFGVQFGRLGRWPTGPAVHPGRGLPGTSSLVSISDTTHHWCTRSQDPQPHKTYNARRYGSIPISGGSVPVNSLFRK